MENFNEKDFGIETWTKTSINEITNDYMWITSYYWSKQDLDVHTSKAVLYFTYCGLTE